MALRTHAHRDALDVPPPDSTRTWIDELASKGRAELERCFRRLRKNQDSGEALDTLEAKLETLTVRVDEV